MNIIDLHSEVWTTLNAWRARLPHALLLTGQRGIGKFELARRFAESLLCEQPAPTHEACGQCLACGWLAQGNHPDLRLLHPEIFADKATDIGSVAGISDSARKKSPRQQITIDQVRALDDFLRVGTHRHGNRIILVHPADAMNRATANALLKSLEEPAPGTVFILTSSESERLLPTIRSRCQTLPVPLPDAERAMAWLARTGVRDGGRWLALAGGSPLLAASLESGEEGALLDALLAEIVRGPGIDPLAAAATLDKTIKADKRSSPLKPLIDWMQKWLLDLLLVSAGQTPRYFVAQMATLGQLARATNAFRLLAFQRKALQYCVQCEQPVNSRLFLEALFLNYAAMFNPP